MPRLFSVLVLTITATLSVISQNVELTFKVDMQNESVSPKGVHVAGTFQAAAGFGNNWDPGATTMTDTDADDIYEITVDVPAGTYLYKFVNGDSWQDKPESPGLECVIVDGGGNRNRQVVVPDDGLTLPPVPFDSCNAVIRFAVNMDGVEVSPEGVFVMGDFQENAGYASNWDPTATKMTDQNKDGTYEVNVSTQSGQYHYLFVNGPTPETIQGACTVDIPNIGHARTVETSQDQTSPPIHCFNTCEDCDPSISENYRTEWWNDAVFYEIFVRSFYDSDGDGIGDFKGITEKLDYLNDGDPETGDDLGITGIWLMPSMPSPSYHGYDVSDYFDIEPDYGTLEDFDEFIAEAHARGIKVIIDFVMNHTSSQHPWFTSSAAGNEEYRDWYVWRDSDPGFIGPWGQQVWYPRNGSYYYGLFWSEMPDLNYDNPEVEAEIFRSAEFWLDRGVDGFRLDAIKYLDEDGTVLENTGKTFEILEDFNSTYKAKNADAVTVGEVWSPTSTILPYIQDGRLDLCFEFDLAFGIVNGVNSNDPSIISNQLETVQTSYPKLQYATFLTNHDIDRVFSTLGGSIAKMKQAASLYLTMPGVPFIYYGEEIGMRGTGAHENIRRPMQWSGGQYAGFSSVSPWYGVGSNYQTNNVTALDTTDASLLDHYRKLIQLRTASPALTKGYLLEAYNSEEEVLAYARIFDNDAFVVISNFGSTPKEVSLEFPITSLEGPDQYIVFDAIDGTQYDVITIQDNGKIEAWNPLGRLLSPRETVVLGLEQIITSAEDPRPLSADRVNLFPNPAVDHISVDIRAGADADGVISLFNTSGLLVQSIKFLGSQTTLDVSSLPPGMYFATVMTESWTTTKPVFIAH